MKPYILKEISLKNLKKYSYKVAILPWGATEAHNYHLPYGTDVYESEYFALKSAEYAWNRGIQTLVLPVIPFGVNTGQFDIPFTINFNPSTQFSILKDIIHSLTFHSINKLVILNSHGGNDFKQMIREFQGIYPDFFICQVNWYMVLPMNTYFEDIGDHASEMETSIMQIIEPDLVLPLSEAGNGAHKNYRFNAIREGWAWAPRKWTKVTSDTGIGDPSKSTPEKGKVYIDKTITQIGDFLIELAECKPGDWYI